MAHYRRSIAIWICICERNIFKKFRRVFSYQDLKNNHVASPTFRLKNLGPRKICWKFWSEVSVLRLFLRACEILPSESKTVKNFFPRVMAFTIETKSIIPVWDDICWWCCFFHRTFQRSEKNCLYFLIPTSILRIVLLHGKLYKQKKKHLVLNLIPAVSFEMA